MLLLALVASTAAADVGTTPAGRLVLPGGAIQVGGGFVVRSLFTSEGPTVRTLGAAANSSDGWLSVTVRPSTTAPGKSWSVVAVAADFRLDRIVTSTATRLVVNDTITSTAASGGGGVVLGLAVQHILVFPPGSTATDALVPGSRFMEHGALCDTTGNYDYVQGMYLGTYGNPTVWATDGTVGVGMLPLDDVFETHAHVYQRAIARLLTQPRHYIGIDFADCLTSEPAELEISDPMLGIALGTSYTQEWAIYGPLGGFEVDNCNDYYCFINAVRHDVRVSAGAPLTTRVNASAISMASMFDPITRRGGDEEWQLGAANFSEPWEHWNNSTLDDYLTLQGTDWVSAYSPWANRTMNCSYGYDDLSCVGSCVNHELPSDAAAWQTLVSEKVNATGKPNRKTLMYFHAEMCSELNASAKYQGDRITNKHGHQLYYACPEPAHDPLTGSYPLFFGNTTNAYGRQLDLAIDTTFKLGMTGVYHDEAAVTATAYTYSVWDGHTAILDPLNKSVVATPGSIPLLRRYHKVKLMERVVYQHHGVLLMNGPPVTRTFREAALRAPPGTVISFVEGEQVNFMLWTHLYTAIGDTREAGRNYSCVARPPSPTCLLSQSHNRTVKLVSAETCPQPLSLPICIHLHSFFLCYGYAGRTWIGGTTLLASRAKTNPTPRSSQRVALGARLSTCSIPGRCHSSTGGCL